MCKFPDFYIVGAPKCGTTSLFEYLNQHPEIFMPKRKEINYFGKDLIFKNYNIDLSYYLSLFKKASPKQVVGEASVWSLYSKTAAYEIFEANPKAKIIIMLRNPVSLIYSLYHELVYTGDECAENFEKALELETVRKTGKKINENSFAVHSTRYREIGSFYGQVKRYLDVFGCRHVKIIIQEEMKSNSLDICKDIYEFLGVDDDFVPEIKIHNVNKSVRVRWLRHLIHRPPKKLRSLIRMIFKDRRHREFITDVLVSLNKKINIKKTHRQKMSPDTQIILKNYFYEDVKNLEKLLSKDLFFLR